MTAEEIVARAICESDGRDPVAGAYDVLPHPWWHEYRREARAALRALEEAGFVCVPREPTADMIAAAWGAWDARHAANGTPRKIGPGPAFVEAMRAMLDAAGRQ